MTYLQAPKRSLGEINSNPLALLTRQKASVKVIIPPHSLKKDYLFTSVNYKYIFYKKNYLQRLFQNPEHFLGQFPFKSLSLMCLSGYGIRNAQAEQIGLKLNRLIIRHFSLSFLV